MASILSKIARAAFSTRTFPASKGRPAAAVCASPAGGRKSEEEEKATPKSEAAWLAYPSQTRAFPLAVEDCPGGDTMSEEEDDDDARPIGYDGHLDVDENALKSDEAMWAFYEYWCKYHGISRDRREMERRFKRFSNFARIVHKFNSASDGSAELSMTKEEVSRRIGRPRRMRPLSP